MTFYCVVRAASAWAALGCARHWAVLGRQSLHSERRPPLTTFHCHSMHLRPGFGHCTPTHHCLKLSLLPQTLGSTLLSAFHCC